MVTIDGIDIVSGSTIDGDEIREITMDGESVWTAIPDSAVLHYPILERSGSTITEELQGEDATAVGTSNVGNNWWKGYAEIGDGTDDRIETPLQNFITDVNDGATLLFTFEANSSFSSSDDDDLMASRESLAVNSFGIRAGDNSQGDIGEMSVFIGDSDGNRNYVHVPVNIDDGVRRRIAIRFGGVDALDWDIYYNGEQQTVNIDENNFSGNMQPLNYPLWLLAMNNQGGLHGAVDGIMDNWIWCDKALSSSEIQDDYDNQPWT